MSISFNQFAVWEHKSFMFTNLVQK